MLNYILYNDQSFILARTNWLIVAEFLSPILSSFDTSYYLLSSSSAQKSSFSDEMVHVYLKIV